MTDQSTRLSPADLYRIEKLAVESYGSSYGTVKAYNDLCSELVAHAHALGRDPLEPERGVK